ncbi:YolD-like family protein [Virgibacillus oceani]
MTNDRGSIKWTTLMLPEHVQMIKEMWAEDDKKEKPIQDEQQIEENVMKLQLAIHDSLTVEVKFFSNYEYHMLRGKLKSIVADDCIIFDDGTKVGINDVIDVMVD